MERHESKSHGIESRIDNPLHITFRRRVTNAFETSGISKSPKQHVTFRSTKRCQVDNTKDQNYRFWPFKNTDS